MFLHKMHGIEKPYLGDDTGRIFRDDTGNTDNGKSIPFLIETKRLHQNLPEEIKTYRKMYVYTKNGQNAVVSVSVDGKDFQVYGQCNKDFTVVYLKDVKGKDISVRITQNDSGQPCTFLGFAINWLREGYPDA